MISVKGDDMQTGSANLALSQARKVGSSLAQLRGQDALSEERTIRYSGFHGQAKGKKGKSYRATTMSLMMHAW